LKGSGWFSLFFVCLDSICVITYYFIFCVIKNPQDTASVSLLVTVVRRNCRNVAGRTGLEFQPALTLTEVILFTLSWLVDLCMVRPLLLRISGHWQVAGSIPDVIGVFHLLNLSDRTMALGSTQASNKNISRALKTAGA
jgi:hypothetical protein